MKWIARLVFGSICFACGMAAMMQWVGHDDGRSLYKAIKRPDVIEKPVEVVVTKVVPMTDAAELQIVNQEFRDTLVKITQAEYLSNSNSTNQRTIERCRSLAEKALAFPRQVVKTEDVAQTP